MSAPDPKAWEKPDDDPEILAFAYGIARRRAIEELKALAVVVCEPCEEMEPRILCRCGCNRFRHSSGRDCEATDILDRIAAIEAEGA